MSQPLTKAFRPLFSNHKFRPHFKTRIIILQNISKYFFLDFVRSYPFCTYCAYLRKGEAADKI